MIVVLAVAGVEIHPPFAGKELLVRRAGPLVPEDRVLVGAALHVDMAGHVHEVARIRHQGAQRVGGLERLFRGRRHLHQVDVEVQDARVPRCARIALQRLFEERAAFQCVGPFGRCAGHDVPHLPGRAIEHRLGRDRTDLEAVGMRPLCGAHGMGEIGVPGAVILGGLALRVAGGQGADQRGLFIRGPVGPRECRLRCVIGRGQRRGLGLRVHQRPGEVVVGSAGIGHAPMGHGAIGVVFERAAIAGDGFLVVVAVGPGQTPVDPQLRLRAGGGDGKRMGT